MLESHLPRPEELAAASAVPACPRKHRRITEALFSPTGKNTNADFRLGSVLVSQHVDSPVLFLSKGMSKHLGRKLFL